MKQQCDHKENTMRLQCCKSKNIYNTQEPQLSSKSEITDRSAMPRKQITVAILAVMATLKNRRGSTDITVKYLHNVKFTSTQAMVSTLLFESRSIILATGQHYRKYILWLYSDS